MPNSDFAPTPAQGATPTKRPVRTGRYAQLVVPGTLGPLAANIEPDRCYVVGLSMAERWVALKWCQAHIDGLKGAAYAVLEHIMYHDGGRGCWMGLRGYIRDGVVAKADTAVRAFRLLTELVLIHERPIENTRRRFNRRVLLPVAAFEAACAAFEAAENGPTLPRAQARARDGDPKMGIASDPKMGITNQEPKQRGGLDSPSRVPTCGAIVEGPVPRGASHSIEEKERALLNRWSMHLVATCPEDAKKYDLAGFQRAVLRGAIRASGTWAGLQGAWDGRVRRINSQRPKRSQAEIDAWKRRNGIA